jgi:hypothetical protein
LSDDAQARVAVGLSIGVLAGAVSPGLDETQRAKRVLLGSEEERERALERLEEDQARVESLLAEAEQRNHSFKRFFVRVRTLWTLQQQRIDHNIADDVRRARIRSRLSCVFERAITRAIEVISSDPDG